MIVSHDNCDRGGIHNHSLCSSAICRTATHDYCTFNSSVVLNNENSFRHKIYDNMCYKFRFGPPPFVTWRYFSISSPFRLQKCQTRVTKGRCFEVSARRYRGGTPLEIKPGRWFKLSACSCSRVACPFLPAVIRRSLIEEDEAEDFTLPLKKTGECCKCSFAFLQKVNE